MKNLPDRVEDVVIEWSRITERFNPDPTRNTVEQERASAHRRSVMTVPFEISLEFWTEIRRRDQLPMHSLSNI